MMKKYNLLTIAVALLLSLTLGSCAESFNDDYDQAWFEVDGEKAYMYGVIDGSTPNNMATLIRENKDLKTIVMIDVPGSADDEANLKAALLIRQNGLNIELLKDSFIASGGVDFFLAGVKRSMESGAQIGVHSWGGEDFWGNTIVAAELGRDDENHKPYLEYYETMGIDTDFYWFTLEASPAESIYIMTEEEIERFSMINN